MEKSLIADNQNDFFSSMRGIDLQELLFQIENYDLEYRKSLNLPRSITFGTEIEYENVPKQIVDQLIKISLKKWTSKNDRSLKSGGEVTSPIMTDNKKDWQELKTICDLLEENNADTRHNAAGHIHIGAKILDQEDITGWRHFLKLYMIYEHVIFRFIYGDKLNGRKRINHYAPPIADKLYKRLAHLDEAIDIYDIQWILPRERFGSINFQNIDFDDYYHPFEEKDTIEFRSPNATTNPVIWQNNINTITKMLLTASKQIMDEEFLDYKLNHEFFPYKEHEYLYDEIVLKDALEFVDLVFDNNLDKSYFLRQYLKNFQNNYGLAPGTKAKQFVR